MKAAGIVAEYNPLHNGHIYHIGETRRLSGCDAVVAAMSGNYVQRGEPAILDKWTRARHALSCGADLVIEIPVLYCLGNAGQYASAAVNILESTGKVEYLSFGSESGDAGILAAVASILSQHAGEIEERVSELRERGLSYPAAREIAFAEIEGKLRGTDPETDPVIQKEAAILSDPNDILAVEYIQSLRSAKPLAVARRGAGYSDPYDEGEVFQSASALRELVLAGHDISRYVPECCSEDLASSHLTGPDTDEWWNTLRYALMSSPAELIEDCPSGGEGLTNLLKNAVNDPEADSWSSFIRKVKTRRYTYTRLSRLCMQALLGITRSAYGECGPEYIRVLGFNDTGRKLLSEIRESGSASLPVITNINKEKQLLTGAGRQLLELDVHTSDIYNLLTGRDVSACSDHRHAPVIISGS